MAAISTLSWQLQRREVEELDKVPEGRELLHWQIQTSSQKARFWLWHFSLLLQGTHDEKEERPFAKRLLLGFLCWSNGPKELGLSWGRSAMYLSVDKGPCSPAQLKSNIQAGWRERPTSSVFWLLQPWLPQQLSTGRYSGWYNWASLQAFIWQKWGSSSVPLGLGFLWEMWIADFKSQRVRAAGLCWGYKQPVQLHSDD